MLVQIISEDSGLYKSDPERLLSLMEREFGYVVSANVSVLSKNTGSRWGRRSLNFIEYMDLFDAYGDLWPKVVKTADLGMNMGDPENLSSQGLQHKLQSVREYYERWMTELSDSIGLYVHRGWDGADPLGLAGFVDGEFKEYRERFGL